MSVRAGTLKENIATLDPIDGIVGAVEVSLPDGSTWSVPNAPGKAASARIYYNLAKRHGGVIGAEAARAGCELYGEYLQEAIDVEGSHPNIDLLLRIAAEDLECPVKIVPPSQ